MSRRAFASTLAGYPGAWLRACAGWAMTGGMTTAPPWDDDLDALGLLCPLPVLKARKRLAAMTPGAVLRVRASDPAAVVDMPHFCAEAGHTLLAATHTDGHQVYLIRRGDDRAPDGGTPRPS